MIDSDGKKRSVQIDADQHPGTLLLPDLPEPGLLVPSLDGPRRGFRYFIALPDSEVFRLKDTYDAEAIGLGTFEIGSFYLLLAKIAHAGAYLYPGDWTLFWEPLLPELIVGERQDYDHFIGGSGDDRDFDEGDGSFPGFYRTVAVDDSMYLVAFSRMFAQNNTPTYQVVVGRRRERVTVPLEDLRKLDPEGLSWLAVNPEKLAAFIEDSETTVANSNG